MKSAFTACLLSALWLNAATTNYIREGASGAGTGADWADAFTTIPATQNRGEVYYFAKGEYDESPYTCNDAESGTSLIIWRKAQTNDHGTATGWSDAYGANPASLPALTFTTGYWVIDGASGSGLLANNLGFISYSGRNFWLDGNLTNVTIQHFDAAGNGRETEAADTMVYAILGASGLTISNCYCHDSRGVFMTTSGTTGTTIAKTRFARNGFASGVLHKEAWSGQVENDVIIRYCVFEDISSTAVIALVNGVGTSANWQVYGNVFLRTGLTTDVAISALFQAKFADPTFITLTGMRFFNNTIIGQAGNAGGFSIGAGSDNLVWNNFWYSNRVSTIELQFADGAYNRYVTNRNLSDANIDALSAGSQPGSTTNAAVPFVDWLGGNFALAAATPSGTNTSALVAGNSVDMFGNTRGADGVWDVGAVEYVSAPSSRISNATIRSGTVR